MQLTTLRKKRKSLGNMLPQTVSHSYSLSGHGTDLNATDHKLVIIISDCMNLVRQYEILT